ncbi:MAG: COX15/CtaA family protein [Ilumatobacteraceae bacterium]
MLRSAVSLRTYSRVSWACLVSLYAIIVSGSLVRLTGSGLGCADWPRCSDERFVDVSTVHAAIEQVNRLFTGVVAIAVMSAALLSFRLQPRQRHLSWLSLGLVAGVVAQVLIGAVVVISGLHPAFNMAHYLVSILLVTISFTLLHRVRSLRQHEISLPAMTSGTSPNGDISRCTRRLIQFMAVLLLAVLIAGTVVTGTGPHAGDETAPRFPFSIQMVTRIHSVIVWTALISVIVIFLRIRRIPNEWSILSRALETLTVLLVAQGFLGYFQYSLGVPAGLVALHVGVSVAVWISALALLETARISSTPASICA